MLFNIDSFVAPEIPALVVSVSATRRDIPPLPIA
jgi:hypothetical protein